MFKNKRAKALSMERLTELRGLAAEGKPVLIDFWQTGCQPCRMMDGIIDELAAEFDGRAYVVKVDVRRAPEAAAAFKVQSTPTFVVLGTSRKKPSKKAKQRTASTGGPAAPVAGPRWRSSGLVRKDVLAGALISNGAGSQ